MRVLMVSSLWPPAVVGGAELYAARLARELREDGHQVAAVTLGVAGADVVRAARAWPCRADEVRRGARWRRPLFHLRDIWQLDAPRAVRDAVATFRPDVVHSHVTQGMSVATLTAPAQLGVPHVHTLHDYWLQCWRSTLTTRSGDPCGRSCAAIGAWRTAALRRHTPEIVIGISQAMLDLHAGVRGRRGTRVVHHPVEAVVPRHAEQRRRPVFGYLGQLTPNKGVAVAIDAARRAGVELLIGGRGTLEPAVRDAQDHRIRYVGWVSAADKDRFFDTIDCLVVPSVWREPAGLVVNEAAARGLPVIATRTGGLPEYVPAACRPLLVPPSDAAALAAALHRFTADPERFRPDPAEQRMTWRRHVDTLVGCYTLAGAAA